MERLSIGPSRALLSQFPSGDKGIYSPKESALALSIVGPLGLSGSLFLGLLVFDFYPPTNRDLYLVVAVVAVVVVVVVGRIFDFQLFYRVYETIFQFIKRLLYYRAKKKNYHLPFVSFRVSH